MRRIVLVWIILVLALAACDDEQPPTQIYVVFSPTPSTGTADVGEDTPNPTPSRTPNVTAAATNTPGAQPTRTALAASATPAPEIFPTNVVSQVPIAEQVFEHGRMFWIRHNRQIWVMIASENDANTGDWYCYNDTFQEGEPEIDPSLTPPEDRFQPKRGFGKLWRSHPEIKDGLGWAITPEFELTSNYSYIAGGYVQNNQYFPGPGEHRLSTLYNDVVAFYEGEVRGECQGGTWKMTPAQ